MANSSLDGGDRPKKKMQPTKEDAIGFGRFLIEVKTSLTNQNIRLLTTAMDFKPAERDAVERDEDPGHVFIHALKEKGIINFKDISILTEKLKFCGLHGVADDVNKSFHRYLSEMKPKGSTSLEFEDKKKVFIEELKNKYNNLCGGIQPVPFLRDRYEIKKIFVESGIEFLEEKSRGSQEQAKWAALKDYKAIFVDSRVRSKRKIIDGEPGYGKSTLALLIGHDWSHDVAPVNDFEILILLRLRKFKNVPTIYMAIKRFLLPKDSSLTEDDIKDILDNSVVLIVLDGYDEYPDRENKECDIEHIIRGDMFQNHEVVLLTRTSCLPLNPSWNAKRIRLTGFDNTAIQTYIQNVVIHNDSDKAEKLRKFLTENPVPADLCKVPLLFVMISHMAHENKTFQNLKTVTEIFRRVVACFHSHEQVRETDGHLPMRRRHASDHSKLDKVAFDGLTGDPQQISWDSEELRENVGDDLYNEYVRVGILQEEELFDDDAIDFKTETRFFHNLFLEWFAAHHLANEYTLPEEELDQNWPEKLRRLKSLSPRDVQYMYRFACGLNRDAAIRIIERLGESVAYGQCTLLCIAEWGGSFEAIVNTLSSLCSRDIHINNRDSLLLQTTTVELLKYASERKIPVSSVWLENCLDPMSLSTANLRLKKLNLSLPVMTTLKKLVIWEEGLEKTEEETVGILEYSAECAGLKEQWFSRCLLPRYITQTECISVLRARRVEVWWVPSGIHAYVMNLESGHWEHHSDGTTMTDDVYERAASIVREYAEWRQKRENSKP